MKKPYLSIITISKNNLHGLKRTVESVNNQSFTDYEHIIVDGDSNDGTKDFIKGLTDAKLKTISEPDAGISDAFNKGVRLSEGEYIVFLNTGDSFVSDFSLDRVCNYYKLDNDVEVFASKIGKDTLPYDPREEGFKEIWNTALIPHQSTFVRRAVFDKVGLFDTSLLLRMDYDFFYRCVKQKLSYNYHFEVIVKYAYGGASSENPEWFRVEGARVFDKYEKETSKNKFYEWILQSGIEIDEKIQYFVIPSDLDNVIYIAMIFATLKARYGKNICLIVESRYSFVLDMYGLFDYQISCAPLDKEQCAMLCLFCDKPTSGMLFVAAPEYYNRLSFSKSKRKKHQYIELLLQFFGISDETTLAKPKTMPSLSSKMEKQIEGRSLENYEIVFPEVSDLFIRKILTNYFGGIEDPCKLIIAREKECSLAFWDGEIYQDICLADMIALAIRCGKVSLGLSALYYLICPFVGNLAAICIDELNENYYDLTTSSRDDAQVTKNLCDWSGGFKDFKASNCAIYGAGAVGQFLKEYYSEHGIQVDYMIDRDLERYSFDIPIFSLEDELPETDMIVVAVINDGRDIARHVQDKTGIRTVYYTDMLRLEAI